MHYVEGGRGVNGVLEFMGPSFLAKYYSGERQQLLQNQIPLLCVALHVLLRMLHISHVDFWVLDVEGAELEVRTLESMTSSVSHMQKHKRNNLQKHP